MLSQEKSPQVSQRSEAGIAVGMRQDNPGALFQDDDVSTAAKKWNSTAFLRLAGGCAVFYVVAQIFQQTSYRLISPGTSLQAEIAARTSALDQIRLALVLLSIFFSVIPFAAVGLRLFRSSPGAALVGFIGCFIFVLSEVFYRGLELFVVSRNWAVRYGAPESAAVREGMAARIEIWNEGVSGWYFVLLLAFLVGSVGFALAAWNKGKRWDKFLAAVFMLNAVRLALRLAHQFADVRWLSAINATIYFPIVLLVFGFLSIWLFHQAVQVNSSSG